MQHNHDSDLGSSTTLESDDNFRKHVGDGARAPRGMLIAVLIGAGMWTAFITGLLALR